MNGVFVLLVAFSVLVQFLKPYSYEHGGSLASQPHTCSYRLGGFLAFAAALLLVCRK